MLHSTVHASLVLVALSTVLACGGNSASDSDGQGGSSAGQGGSSAGQGGSSSGQGGSTAGQGGASGSSSGGTGGAAGAGSGGTSGGGTSGGGAGGVAAGGTGGKPLPEPVNHRPDAVACDRERPPGDECSGTCDGTAGCGADSHCTAGENGRCEQFRGSMECTYDECFEDSDCSGGGPCGCELEFWSDANTCLAGNCRTDGDCGKGGYCSPSFSECGNYSGVVGYYCHTAEDECTDDAECVGGAGQGGPGYCMYSPQASHWVCSYSQCVG